MATKAERFRYEAQRAGQPVKKRKTKKNGAGLHGPSRGRKAVFAFEETPPSVPPSRKSTRKSKHRQKGGTALTSRNLSTKSSPKARHDMGATNLRAPR